MDTDSGVFRFARISGIDIKAHWSWVLVLFLLTFQLAVGYFPGAMPGAGPVVYWILGLVGSLMLFFSVLVHELCHSLVAKANGYGVRDITLFIFGGVSNIEEEARSARDEFLIAVVGPLSSLVLAALFFAFELVVSPPMRKVGASAAAIAHYLAVINFLLALFNMIPGFPLDGGRVLRSIIWAINKNFQSATRIAAFVGQLVAYAFIFYGLYQAFLQNDFIGGLWIAFIGWFLLNAARQSAAGVGMRDVIRGSRVAEVMTASPPAANPYMPIGQLLTGYLLPYSLKAVPVVDQLGRLVGIITLADIREIPQEQWATTTVGEVMTGAGKLKAVTPQEQLERAVQILSEGDFDQLPVVEMDGRLVGIITRGGIMKWMQARSDQRSRGAAKASAPTPSSAYPPPGPGPQPGAPPPPSQA